MSRYKASSLSPCLSSWRITTENHVKAQGVLTVSMLEQLKNACNGPLSLL